MKDSLNVLLEEIQNESERIWWYLGETIEFIEKKYWLHDWFDVNELVVYSKSCKDSYKRIKKLTSEIKEEIKKKMKGNAKRIKSKQE